MEEKKAEKGIEVKKFLDMTTDELKKLLVAKVTLSQIVSNFSKETRFTAKIDFGHGLTVAVDRNQFSESVYNLLVYVYNRVQDAQRGPVTLNMPCVIYKGSTIREDGRKFNYYQFDVLAYRDVEEESIVHFTGFFDNPQKIFIRLHGLDGALKVIDRGIIDKSAIPSDVFSGDFINHIE